MGLDVGLDVGVLIMGMAWAVGLHVHRYVDTYGGRHGA